MKRWLGTASVAALGLLLGSTPSPASEQRTLENHDWCDDEDHGRRARHCEVREVTLPAGRDVITVDAHPNGGIDVEGWEQKEIRLLAKVVANARTEEDAEELAAAVQIETSDTIRAKGPRTRGREGWWVSYRLWVPSKSNLSLESMNGGIGVENVSGRIDFRTTNGGVELTEVAGDVRGRTTNGGLRIRLSGDTWEGPGLDVETTNGGVRMAVPEGYNAELETGTTNGDIRVDFPVTVQGRIRRSLNVTLGEGGPTVRAMTTNGGVRIEKR